MDQPIAPAQIEQAQTWFQTYGPIALKALLILIVGWIVAKILTATARHVMHKAWLDQALVGFASSLTFALLMTVVVISAIGELGVQTASFAAVIAAAGFAIGFALQGSLANFAAGVMVIIFRPFKAGDYVEVGGISGSVQEVQIFATTLNTPDNKRVIVPNSEITGKPITNYSATGTRRVDQVFGIGYGDDIKKAKGILENILAQDTRVLKDPAPTVAVAELGDSSANLAVRPWVNTPDYWDVLFHVTEAVKQRFDAEGISIPFPQRDVHLRQVA
ncbi:MAG: mechanosensitive ion channel [Planctomycetes bacterium]|nr:mechanosensitive ion channel [Planctomycetota bacterium]